MDQRRSALLTLNGSAVKFAEEVRAAVAVDDLARATNRLLDFAKESGRRDLVNAAIGVTGDYHRLRKDLRRFGETHERTSRQSELSQRLLELVDEIEGLASATAAPPGSHPLRTVPAAPEPPERRENRGAERAVPRIEGWPSTALEHARAEFVRRRQPDPVPALERPATVLAARGLTKRYRGAFELAAIDLELRPGEVVGLVGVNGSGKTTLLRLLAGDLGADAGELAYPLLSPDPEDWVRIKSQIAFVPQRLPPWHGRLADNLHLQAALHGFKGRENEDEVEFILHRLGLTDYRRSKWSEISGGYQMRFALARALLAKPRLLILDEPLAPLDINTQQLFLRDLRDLADSLSRPLAILLSSQHIFEVEAIADVIFFLDDGKPVFSGSLRQLYEQRRESTFELATPVEKAGLLEALEGLGVIAVEPTGLTFLLSLPPEVTAPRLLEALLAKRIEVEYFRGISNSTRKLFRGKGG